MKAPAASTATVIIAGDIISETRADHLYKFSAFDESLLDAIPFYIDIVDEDLNILYMNKELENKIGRRVIGQKCFQIYKDDCNQCNACPLKAHIDTGDVSSIEVDGVFGQRSFRIKHRVIEIKGKKAVLEVFEDITEHKAADKKVQESLERLRRVVDGTVYALASTVEKRDPYTAGHQQRVSSLACAIAKEIGLPELQIQGLHISGLLHDIGKISIPAEILSKPSRLTDIEFSLIKTHPQVGYDILQKVEFAWPVAQIILQHHEKMDGSGYPFGISGEAILLEARILLVADFIEAVASHRPYRPSLGIEFALEEISKGRGIQYDSHIVDACLRLFKEKGFNL